MIKDFPHYSDAATRAALKMLRGQFGYKGEAMWWHLLERLNQHDTQPIDLTDEHECFLTCEYIHPLEHSPDKRKEEVFAFLDFCASYKGRDGEALIDPAMWSEKKVWNSKATRNQTKVLKRRVQKDDVPEELVEFAKKMLDDIRVHTKHAQMTPKWPRDIADLLRSYKVSLDEAKAVWNWLQTSTHRQAEFYRMNVVKCPAKFKKQFAQIESYYSQFHASAPATKRSFFER